MVWAHSLLYAVIYYEWLKTRLLPRGCGCRLAIGLDRQRPGGARL